jgi:arsenite-transporting ATPase
VLSLLTLAEQVRHGPWDLLVVDAGTGPEALRLLTIADDVLRVADGLWSPERRLGLRLRRPHPIVSHVVSRLRGELAEARSVLRTPTTSVRLVLSPERAAVTHARRTATALTVRGYAVDGVVATRVLTDETAWPRPLVAAQRELLDATETAFAPTAVHRVPYLLAEPAREALAALGDGVLGATPERGGGVERALAPVVVPQPRVRRADDVFELVVAVPFVSAADVDLVRHGDELHLSVPGTRHVIALPSVLRRCLVTGASVADGRLVVRFEPDPSLWPQPSSAGEGAGPEVVR